MHLWFDVWLPAYCVGKTTTPPNTQGPQGRLLHPQSETSYCYCWTEQPANQAEHTCLCLDACTCMLFHFCVMVFMWISRMRLETIRSEWLKLSGESSP